MIAFYRVKVWNPSDTQIESFTKSIILPFTSLIVDGQLPAWNPFVELNKANEEDALKELVLDIEAALERYPESYKV